MRVKMSRSSKMKLAASATTVLATLSLGGMASAGASNTPTSDFSGISESTNNESIVLSGKVIAISLNSITLRIRSGAERTFVISPDTSFQRNGQLVSVDNIRVGSRVGIVTTDYTNKIARSITTISPEVGGRVIGIEGANITIKNMKGKTLHILTSPSTAYYQNGNTANLSSVQMGSDLLAKGTFQSGSSINFDAARIITGMRPEEIRPENQEGITSEISSGKIITVNENRITIANRMDTLIIITSKDTIYTHRGKLSTASVLKPGTFILAKGSFSKGSKTVFDASTIIAGPPEGARGNNIMSEHDKMNSLSSAKEKSF